MPVKPGTKERKEGEGGWMWLVGEEERREGADAYAQPQSPGMTCCPDDH